MIANQQKRAVAQLLREFHELTGKVLGVLENPQADTNVLVYSWCKGAALLGESLPSALSGKGAAPLAN